MAFAFGRDRRLRNHAEFVKAQRLGRRVVTPHFTLLVAPQPGDPALRETARIGFVVGRKAGNAVRRNRIKRLCRECFRLWPELLPPGVDLVVIARANADELSLASVRAEWADVYRQLRRRATEALARRDPTHHPPLQGP